MSDCICVFVIEFVLLFMTVVSLDSAAGKETLTLPHSDVNPTGPVLWIL